VVRYQRLGRPSAANDVKNSCIAFVCSETDRYVLGKPLSQEFVHIVTKDGWTFEQVGQFVNRYLSILAAVAKTDGFVVDAASPAPTLPGQYIDCMPQNIMADIQGNHTFIDKEWQLKAPVEINHLVFRSLLFLCDAITRFGGPATGENLTIFQFIEKACAAAGLKVQHGDFDRFEALEAELQLAVSGMDTQAFFKLQKTRMLSMMTLSQIVAERDLQISQLNQRIANLHNSASWQITAPFRYLSKLFKK
jgi:O-antigen biosynthesis protein